MFYLSNIKCNNMFYSFAHLNFLRSFFFFDKICYKIYALRELVGFFCM